MKKPRRNNSALPPLTPEGCDGESQRIAALLAECAYLRRELGAVKTLLAGERKRHAGIEAVTLRAVTELQGRIETLKTAISETPSALGAAFTVSPLGRLARKGRL